jgi:hypothetical protein
MNQAGSQKLIDKRRKMKDTKGAEYAMRVAEESWKGGPAQSRKPPSAPPRRGASTAVPVSGSRDPRSHGGAPHHSVPHGHYYPPHAYGYVPPHLGYSPMAPHYPPSTPGYNPRTPVYPMSHGRPHSGHVDIAPRPSSSAKRSISRVTPGTAIRTPAKRAAFDPAASRRKRRKGNAPEVTEQYFGTMPAQPKTTALAIFSYLSNEDVYSAALVCKKWSVLAMDEELWQFS